MILIWSGLGIVVPILTVIILFLTQLFADSVFGAGFYTAHGLPKLFAFWVSAALMWVIGSALAKQPGRVLYDPQTGQQVALKKRHSFFFIPVQYWACLLFAFGLVALFL